MMKIDDLIVDIMGLTVLTIIITWAVLHIIIWG